MASIHDVGTQRPNQTELKINNATKELNNLKIQVEVLTRNLTNFVREFNKMKNDMGAMRKKHKSEIQSLASKIK